MQDAGWRGHCLVPALASPDTSHEVTDADEEIFLLYTLSAPEPNRMGLGQVDNKSDLIQVTIDLDDPNTPLEISPIDRHEADQRLGSREKVAVSHSKGTRARKKTLLQVTIRQDSTSLRSTGGDTGSVIWRSSLYLAEKIIRDLSEIDGGKRQYASEWPHFLLEPTQLTQCRVLELGSGTGILPLLLLSHPYLARPESNFVWLATDQPNMLPLLQKNLSSTSAHIGALDWVEASAVYKSSSDSVKHAFLRSLTEPFGSGFADLIIATDCIFNPSLFAPLVDTLNLCSSPKETLVMIVCELREPDAMTEFLQTWLNTGERGERWSIFALEGEAVLGSGLLRGSVIWVGCRVC